MATRPSSVLTKKTPTPTEASWQQALARFDDWQRARGMGEKTRKAYGVDLAQLADWAAARDLGPLSVTHRELRHFAGVVSERGAVKATVARKLAAIRTFYRQLVERGELEANPAELVSSPKKDSYLPQGPEARARWPSCSSGYRALRRSTCATAPCSSWPTRRDCAWRSS